ncbi:hypothetical protein POTOM_009329 [Populus tomentosa]|uniref:CCHC-type domain-containing protein n=1 Tax=Populus tomentosa TaxID=118781 RepID=A0A8X8D1A7_POPTO|nr:hypothetical protein POTOM_009329 [Populus tomentosa]
MLGEQKEKTKITSNGPQCYKCKGFGHYAVVCPTRDRKLVFICEKELTIMDDTKGGGTEEFAAKEEHLDASQLPSCVIHQILTGNKKELKTNQEWLRTNIAFRSPNVYAFQCNLSLLLVITISGSKPSLAVLAVFGVPRLIQYLKSGKDMVAHTRIGEWSSRMENAD